MPLSKVHYWLCKKNKDVVFMIVAAWNNIPALTIAKSWLQTRPNGWLHYSIYWPPTQRNTPGTSQTVRRSFITLTGIFKMWTLRPGIAEMHTARGYQLLSDEKSCSNSLVISTMTQQIILEYHQVSSASKVTSTMWNNGLNRAAFVKHHSPFLI